MNMSVSRFFAAPILAVLTTAVCAISTPVAASTAPILLHGERRIVLHASVAAVWAKLGKFDDLTWVSAVRSVKATKGNKIGSNRSLDLGGRFLTETLLSYSGRSHSYTYGIDGSDANRRVVPVSNGVGGITVSPTSSGGSVLTFRFECRRLDWSETPQPGADDATARHEIDAALATGISSAVANFAVAK